MVEPSYTSDFSKCQNLSPCRLPSKHYQMVLLEAISSPVQILSRGWSQHCSFGVVDVGQKVLAAVSLVPSLVLEAHAAAFLAGAAAALLAVEAVAAIEEEAGQNEVQQVHVLAAQAPVVTHPGCPLQTFAALMMLTMEYRMEQRL